MSEHPQASSVAIVPVPTIQTRILVIRGQQVLLDEDLADLYGVQTGALTRAVRRNRERFPEDFMFQLTREEYDDLKRQIGISSGSHGGRRYAPYVLTEQGVAMLSSVLRSDRAVAVNIEIMRAFVQLRQMAASHTELGRRLDELERETRTQLGQHNQQIAKIFQALRQLTAPPPKRKHPIGFTPPKKKNK